jgi:hypothetical protein
MVPFVIDYDEIELRNLEGAKRFQWPEYCGQQSIKAHCATMRYAKRQGYSTEKPEEFKEAFHADPHPEEVVPSEGCGCGFWAYWDSELSVGALLGKIAQTPFVIGVMEGHGSVLIGEKGFRSEYAKLLGVAVIREHYGYQRTDIEEAIETESAFNSVSRNYRPITASRGLLPSYKGGTYGITVKCFDAPTYQNIREELSMGYPGVYVAKDVRDLITEFGYEEEYRQNLKLRPLYEGDIMTPRFEDLSL